MKHNQDSEFYNQPKFPIILVWLALLLFVFVVITIGIYLFKAKNLIETIVVDPTPTTIYQPDLDKYINTDNFSPWLGTSLKPAIKDCAAASWYFGISSHVFLGISFAESTFKNFPENSYNPFGVMRGRSIKKFNSWHHACNYFASLMKYNYFEKNLVTPEQLYPIYVNYDNPNWLKAVRTYWNPEAMDASLKY